MKSIHTLIQDIYELLKRKDGWFDELIEAEVSGGIAARLRETFSPRQSRGLRLSGLGPRCPKALWHSIHTPELAEPVPGWAEMKFAYGHILEALIIPLAKAAGHEVTGEQDELVLDGITGHRDCVIDGCVVDIKSRTSRGLDQLRKRTLAQDDPFGVLYQLDGYLGACAEDPLVRVKDRGYLLGIDKTLGHMVLYEHKARPNLIRDRIASCKDVAGRSNSPPCGCNQIAIGKSGNIGLDLRASYEPFKFCCFPQLRTFIYTDGPVYLTKVVRKPDVTEVDRYGRTVYMH